LKIVLGKSLADLVDLKFWPLENTCKHLHKIKTLKTRFFIKLTKNVKERFLHLCMVYWYRPYSLACIVWWRGLINRTN